MKVLSTDINLVRIDYLLSRLESYSVDRASADEEYEQLNGVNFGWLSLRD